MCEELARQPDEFNGHLVMFRSFYNFNLKGEDELISKGAYLHIQGLKGLGVQELQESLGMVLTLCWHCTERAHLRSKDERLCSLCFGSLDAMPEMYRHDMATRFGRI